MNTEVERDVEKRLRSPRATHIASYRLLTFLVLMLCGVGCVDPAIDVSETNAAIVNSETVAVASNQSGEIESEFAAGEESKSPSPPTAFVMQELPQLKSPFTKKRVLALNAIVEKSLKIITEFDELRQNRKASEDDRGKFLAAVAELSRQAAEVANDMALAKTDLENSGEHYNKPIFAAMEKFVVDVDKELKRELSLKSIR